MNANRRNTSSGLRDSRYGEVDGQIQSSVDGENSQRGLQDRGSLRNCFVLLKYYTTALYCTVLRTVALCSTVKFRRLATKTWEAFLTKWIRRGWKHIINSTVLLE